MTDNSNNNSEATSTVEKNTKKRGRTAIISDEQFIAAHQQASCLQDIIDSFEWLSKKTTEQAKLYVSMRASGLRKKGIILTTFKRGRKTFEATTVTENNTSEESTPQTAVAE